MYANAVMLQLESSCRLSALLASPIDTFFLRSRHKPQTG